MPDTCALADYVTADEMDTHLRSVMEKVQKDEIRFVHIGFHQESANRYVDRIAACVAKWQENADIEFMTLEDAAQLAQNQIAEKVEANDEETIWPTDSWETSTLEAEGFDANAINEMVKDIRDGKYGLVDHFLMIRNGRVVADHHFEHDYQKISAEHNPVDQQYDYDHPNWHPYYQETNLHSLQSVTKSVTSIGIGIAIDEGHIPDGVETPAMSFFNEYEHDLEDQRKKSMRLHDLLTMRSGIAWNEMMSYDDERNSCTQLEDSDDWIQFVLDQPMREEPGTRFDYNSGVSVLIGKVVQVATGQRVDQYLNEKLFQPLGIKNYFWKKTPKDEIDTEGGLYLSPHDLARIGYLFLRKGQWNGQQIVSPEWVETSTSPIVKDIFPKNGRVDKGYGFQWWVPEQKDDKATIYSGSGYGGQFPFVVPEYDLVIVFNAWNIHDAPKMSAQRAVQDRILPAIKKQ